METKLCFSPCGPDEMNSDDVLSIMTPKVKKDLASLFSIGSDLKSSCKKVRYLGVLIMFENLCYNYGSHKK